MTAYAKRIANRVFLVLFLLSASGPTGYAWELEVPYVTTPHRVVEVMLDLAEVGPADYLIDLGSGDGRIVIAAAKRGAFGHGVDINPARVWEAERNARSQGVSDRVVFFQQDLFEADISRATVVTMFLLTNVNLKLKPRLFEQLRPGTRIVSNTFSMGQWKADKHVYLFGRNVFYWVMPADLSGRWAWEDNGESFFMDVRQKFQQIEVHLRAGDKMMRIMEPVVVGERVGFTAEDPDSGARYAFQGRVAASTITGTKQKRDGKNRRIENWTAILKIR